MSQLLGRFHGGVKSSSTSLFTLVVKVVSGLILGLTFALIGQQLMSYGDFSFIFMTVITLLIFLRMVRSWGLVGVIIFDLICVLIGLVLRMYILVAPGA